MADILKIKCLLPSSTYSNPQVSAITNYIWQWNDLL